MKSALQILSIIALLGLGTPLLAEESPTPLKHYEIEVIVFTRNQEGAGSSEHWPPLSEPPDWSQSVSLKATDAPEAAITELPASAHRLKKEYGHLRATRGRLRPVIHAAWRQPLLSAEQSIPVYLRSKDVGKQVKALAGETFPELEGTIRVDGKRYLHVHLDLLLRRLRPPDLTSDEATDSVGPTVFAPQYQVYRMIDHRRMRSDRLHYIDHPLFGVLVLATPYVSAEAGTPEQPTPRAPVVAEPTEDSKSQSGRESPPQSGAADPENGAGRP